MIVYRIARNQYIEDLTGIGAELYGGRWNHPGNAVLYCSTHLSLCVLELLANQSWQLIQKGYSFLELEIPDEIVLSKTRKEALHPGWRSNPYHHHTIHAGTSWLKKQETVGMLVPSAVLPQEFNLLLNPAHPRFRGVKMKNTGSLHLDPRIS